MCDVRALSVSACSGSGAVQRRNGVPEGVPTVRAGRGDGDVLMPGTNAGTGQPLTLRCAKCKTTRFGHDRGTHLEATGRTRAVRQKALRQTNRKIEYRCLDCGHVGWTQHESAERLLAVHVDAEQKRVIVFAENL